MDFACFPLVPYANRIAQGRFSFEGREVSLPVLPKFAPHALHGEGWLKPWHVIEHRRSSLMLGLGGGGEAWPWRYEARQKIELSDSGASIALSLTNRDDERMPAGLGLHPYFPCQSDGRLEAAVEGVWIGDSIVPDRLAPLRHASWEGSKLVEMPFVDHCYEGWSGFASVSDRGGTTILSSAAKRLHVYVPPRQGYFCLEPVTHRPDVFNQAAPGEQGFTVLAPGETLSLEMTIARL